MTALLPAWMCTATCTWCRACSVTSCLQ